MEREKKNKASQRALFCARASLSERLEQAKGPGVSREVL